MDNITEITPNKLNILYTRVSSISQETNTSLDYQQSNLLQYCKTHKIDNATLITDVDSGSKERKGIKEIKSLIKMNCVDTIYITKLDRLYRSIVEGSSFIKLCLDNGVNIITSLETTDTTTSSGMLQIHLLMSIADYERRCIRDRTWTGKVSTFNNGKRAHGNIAIGYIKSHNEYILDESEAPIIQLIYSLYRKFNSLAKVKKELDGMGYTTRRGNSFGRKSIYNILTNRFYVGDVWLKGEYISGIHPPLISRNLFTRIGTQLSGNKKG
jgi:DNA invertase Pin-like site-specific DNA recombinase